jgi:hypothetical protein
MQIIDGKAVFFVDPHHFHEDLDTAAFHANEDLDPALH